MYCFGYVRGLNFVRIFEVGDGPADFQNPIVSPRRKTQACHRALQHAFTLGINAAMTSNQPRCHRSVCKDSVARETFEKNGKPNRWAQHDVGLATENLLLEAVELGLAAHPMAGYDADRARSEFDIPEGHTPIAMIAIGYPYRGRLEDLDEKLRGKEFAPRERKPIGALAFSGRWNQPYDAK